MIPLRTWPFLTICKVSFLCWRFLFIPISSRYNLVLPRPTEYSSSEWRQNAYPWLLLKVFIFCNKSLAIESTDDNNVCTLIVTGFEIKISMLSVCKILSSSTKGWRKVFIFGFPGPYHKPHNKTLSFRILNGN